MFNEGQLINKNRYLYHMHIVFFFFLNFIFVLVYISSIKLDGVRIPNNKLICFVLAFIFLFHNDNFIPYC